MATDDDPVALPPARPARGRPAARAHRRADAARRAEENYWFRRHLVVYEWIAGARRRPRVVDMACGEGYGADVLAQRRAGRRRRRRQPRGPRARAAALPRADLRFARDLVERFAEPCDAVTFLQTIEHVQDPDGCSSTSRR